jgi:hypothetical protein
MPENSFCQQSLLRFLWKKFKMKKLLFAFSVLIICACNSSDKKTGVAGSDDSLKQRLAEFLKATDDMDLEKSMDYIYPKMFTIVPREELVKAMKEGFENENVQVELDAVRIDTIYPVFEMSKGKYAKVKYAMTMLMNFKTSSDNDDTTSNDMIFKTLAQKYGEEHVSWEKPGVVKINITSPMVAAKDEFAKEWSFVNLEPEDPISKKLFSQEIMDKLATYN